MLMTLRRWLWRLGAVVAGAGGGFGASGVRALPPHSPPPPPARRVATPPPGDGGLRRPFPAMVVRPDHPVLPQRVALGRLLYFDPVVSGANDMSWASCHHPDLGLT